MGHLKVTKFLVVAMSMIPVLPTARAGVTHEVNSPDGKLRFAAEVGPGVGLSLVRGGVPMLLPSAVGMDFGEAGSVGAGARLAGEPGREQVRAIVRPPYGKRSEIRDEHNRLTLPFEGGFALEMRAYDAGVAWRWVTKVPGRVKVMGESAALRFPAGTRFCASFATNWVNSYEDFYTRGEAATFPEQGMAVLPALFQSSAGVNLAVTESDLRDYPGMYLRGGEGGNILADFPRVALKDVPGGWMNFHKEVVERGAYLAETDGARSFPWRALIVAPEDKGLIGSDLVHLLARPHEGDFSWVRPGKVAWDWWNDWNLKGVPFRAGINVETYKYYIDFAAANGLEYVNLDEGWSDQFDLFKLRLDLGEVIRHAKSKGVGVFLWCVARTLDAQMEAAMSRFEEWGVAGLKVDFMDRDDQEMVDFYWRCAKAAAGHHLMVNFHGAHKPAGLMRTFPNVVNQEGVRGLEYNKFAPPDGTTLEHALTIPFVRMLAGPMDYTPGAMRNANRGGFAINASRPMSHGTRCQQLAMYVVYDAPLAMLADAPTSYQAEPEIMEFLGPVPTTWDETIALAGRLGEHIAVARRKGERWYLAGMCDWRGMEMSLGLDFLGSGNWQMDLFADGINADRHAEDWRRERRKISAEAPFHVHLAPGGGFAAVITRLK